MANTTPAPTTASLLKPLPSLPVDESNVFGAIEALYPAADHVLVYCQLPSGAVAEPAAKAAKLRQLPGLATIIEQYRYATIEDVYVDVLGREINSFAAVGLGFAEATTTSFATISALATRVFVNVTSLTGGNNVTKLGFQSGMSRQLNPPPVDGTEPVLHAVCGSPTAASAFVTVIFVIRVRGQRVIHASL